MLRHNVRFLQKHELDLLRSMFEFNPYSNGIKLTDEQIGKFCKGSCKMIASGLRHIAINMDENDNPIAMSVGTEKPNINGWVQGLTMVTNTSNHATTSIKKLTPAMDALVELMESKKYYKFWDISLESKILNLGRSIVLRYSTTLNRYDYYDEMIIPAGKKSEVKLWDINRRIHPTKEMMVRMFVLNQESRIKLLKTDKTDKIL
jgi:hypothetical protein